MTSLAEACAELAAWLPQAAQLITEPDTQPSAGSGTSTGSAPPWNTAAANAWYDAHAAIRDTEQTLRYIVTGATADVRPWSDRHTTAALTAIEKLGDAVPQERARQAASQLTAATTAILTLPAVDEAERPQKVAFACPYCGFAMVRVYPKAGRVVCIRAIAGCTDADGNPPQGTIGTSQLDGTPRITWKDGLVT